MKWIYRFFVVLGAIFFLILLGLAYFIIADPLNLRPIMMSMYGSENVVENSALSEEGRDATGVEVQAREDLPINETQASALESVGINPASVPNQFTSEQVTCFVGILGQARVDAIVAGDTPTPSEFYKAKECL
jgi:hypothetical protein